MKIVLLLLAVLMTGCSDMEGEQRDIVRYESFCSTPEEAKKRADFILGCIEGANPKSDEEPEDWIRICESMAIGTACPMVRVKKTQECEWDDGFSCVRWVDVNVVRLD